MVPKIMMIARGLSIAIIIVIYALLVHRVNASGQASALGAVLVLAPMLLLALTFAKKTASRMVGLGVLLIFFAGSWLAWSLIKQHTGFIFWLQDISLMLLLMMTFGRTLLHGRKPLCVHFAEMINGEALSAQHARYAHKVTVAWVIFFAMMIVISSVLYFVTPLTTWSFFVNFLTLPLVALMFIAEFIVRRRVLTDLPSREHMFDAVRAYVKHSARAH